MGRTDTWDQRTKGECRQHGTALVHCCWECFTAYGERVASERAHSAKLAERVAELERELKDREAWLSLHEEREATDNDFRIALAASQAENVRLRRFCDRCWDIARDGCDMDGAEIQESLVANGFLVGTKRSESCGENCRCAEYFGTDEPWTCYEPVPPSPAAALREVLVDIVMDFAKARLINDVDREAVGLYVDGFLDPEVKP